VRPASRAPRGPRAPTQTGSGRCTGPGVTRPLSHSLGSVRTACSRASYRRVKSAPKAANSPARQPAPSPSSSRPSLRMSTTAACSARAAGGISGVTTTAVPMRARLVRAATAAQKVSGAGR
jgi:hypothetical protein